MADNHDAGSGGANVWEWFAILLAIAIFAVVIYGIKQPFSPTYLNINYVFGALLAFSQGTFTFQLGNGIYITVGIIVVFLIALNFYLFVRLLEMEEEHEDHVYHHADEHTRPTTLLGTVIADVKEFGRDVAGAGHNDAVGSTSLFDRAMYRDEADLVDKSVDIPEVPVQQHDSGEKEGSSKWRMVLKHSSSKNPSDWKIAIIEADTILDALVERAGYPGDSLGERLKNADKGAFRTLDYAWEAHKVRNRIAHEGSNFSLTERDAKNTIKQYEEVFREFQYI